MIISKFTENKDLISYGYLFKWICIALTAGFIGSLTVHFFTLSIRFVFGYISASSIPLWIFPSLGALIAGGIFYRIEPHSAGEGIPSYIRGLRIHKGDLLFSVTINKLFAAFFSLAFLGNGGLVGPLGRISSGLMAKISNIVIKAFNKKISFNENDRKTAAICGLAAVIGAVFHSSIGGGIFAVEIIKKAKLGYKDLFPSILASSVSVLIAKGSGWESLYKFNVPDHFMDIHMTGWLLLLAVISGIIGGGYSSFYGFMSRLLKRKEGNLLLKVVAGSLSAGLIAWAVNPYTMGTSDSLIPAILSNDLTVLSGNLSGLALPTCLILIIMLICKGLCNCITVSSGMSAGFTGPSAIIGMLLGSAFAHFLNVEYPSPTFYAFVAAGFSGVLSSSMNIPLAAAVITIENFGLHNSFPAGLGAITGFQIMRHKTIYNYALGEIKDIED